MDYPTWAIRNNVSVLVQFELTVDPEGRIIDCKVLSYAGSERLAEEICRQTRRTKALPAYDALGMETYGKYVSTIRMLIPGTDDAEQLATLEAPADVELTVASLPPEDGDRKDVTVAYQASEDGVISECRGAQEDTEAYANAGCEVLRNQKVGQMTDKDGIAVPYVGEMKVAFVLDDAA